MLVVWIRKMPINVVHPDFHKKFEMKMEKKLPDTGSFKQLVENYAQDNTNPVTCFKLPLLILSFITISLVPLSEVNDLLIKFRDISPLYESISNILHEIS